MKKISIALAALCIFNFSMVSCFDDMNMSTDARKMNNGFFMGLGGSYNSINFDQYLTGTGDSNVYDGSTLIAFGDAGGPASPFHATQSTFAPVFQLGYCHKLSEDNDWLLGLKFSYRYLGISFAQQNINSFQAGTFTNTGDAPTDTFFTGHFIIGSSQVSIQSELNLLAFAGYSFADNYNVYVGASPLFLSTKSNIYQAIGYADINGTHTDITNLPVNFSHNDWMFGGAGEIGINYHFNSSWFLNLSYNYAITGTSNYSSTAGFKSETVNYVTTGTFTIEATQRIITQAISAAITFEF